MRAIWARPSSNMAFFCFSDPDKWSAVVIPRGHVLEASLRLRLLHLLCYL